MEGHEWHAARTPDEGLRVEQHGHALVPDRAQDALERQLGLAAREAQDQRREDEVHAATARAAHGREQQQHNQG